MQVILQPSAGAAADFAADVIAQQLRARPESVLGLATGRTMEAVYARLAAMHADHGLDFARCVTFNLDEYLGIPATQPQSYRHYMNQHLFEKVNIHIANTHLPDGLATDLENECARYEQRIDDADGIDLQLLGIGSNGHLGFNEPLSSFKSRTRVVTLAPETVRQNAHLFGGPEFMPRQAITMGVGTILESRRCVLLATGKSKASILAQAIEGPITSMISATALQLHPDCVVIADEAAASELTRLDCYRAAFENDPRWKRIPPAATWETNPSRWDAAKVR